MESGFTSIVQYQPDAARQEVANVGLVLFVPGLRRLDLKMAAGVGHVQRFFGKQHIDGEFLADMKRGFEGRLRAEAKTFHSEADLVAFASRLGNELRMTEPRGVAVSTSFDALLERLFDRLVAEPKPSHVPRSRLGNRLRGFFDRLPKEAIPPSRKIDLPEIETIEAPFAYLNGTLNLVKPIALGDKAKDEARSWLLVDQILRENASRFEKVPKIEIVLAKADSDKEAEQRAYCEKVLSRTHVGLFTEERFEEFESHVARSLHSSQ